MPAHLRPPSQLIPGVQPHWPSVMSLNTLCSFLSWGLCTCYSLCLRHSSHLLLPLQNLVQAAISFFLNYFLFLFDICHEFFFLFVKIEWLLKCFNNSSSTDLFNGIFAISSLAHLYKNIKKVMILHLTNNKTSILSDGQQAHEKMLNITNY